MNQKLQQIVFVMLSSLLCSTSFAESWHADPVTGCTIYDSNDDVLNVIVSWTGGCDSKKRASGEGVLSWIEDGKFAGRYVGPMEGGKAQGVGIIYIAADDGFDRYEGVFINGGLEGQTQAVGADGTLFSGTLNGADFSGQGVFTSSDGDKYTGEFANGELNGQGHLVQASGEQFRGTFNDSVIADGGEWLGPNGDYYKGGFANGEFSGVGRYEAVDGSVYVGDFVGGLPEGQGRYTDAGGRVTAGTFLAGWPDGQVDITTTDGRTLSEFWSDGEIEGL
jgi:hypothetical protein